MVRKEIASMKNSEIIALINETFEYETDRKIMVDRLVNAMLYTDLIKKYHPNQVGSERFYKIFRSRIANMEGKLYDRL